MSDIFSGINKFDLRSSSATKIKSKVVGVFFFFFFFLFFFFFCFFVFFLFCCCFFCFVLFCLFFVFFFFGVQYISGFEPCIPYLCHIGLYVAHIAQLNV